MGGARVSPSLPSVRLLWASCALLCLSVDAGGSGGGEFLLAPVSQYIFTRGFRPTDASASPVAPSPAAPPRIMQHYTCCCPGILVLPWCYPALSALHCLHLLHCTVLVSAVLVLHGPGPAGVCCLLGWTHARLCPFCCWVLCSFCLHLLCSFSTGILPAAVLLDLLLHLLILCCAVLVLYYYATLSWYCSAPAALLLLHSAEWADT